MRELESTLPDLAPPPGGLARLQRSVQTRTAIPRGHLPAWVPLTAGTCALALLTLTWLPGVVARHQRSAALSRALQHAVTPPLSPHGIRVIHGAALELPGTDDNVRVYLVQTDAARMHDAPSRHRKSLE